MNHRPLSRIIFGAALLVAVFFSVDSAPGAGDGESSIAAEMTTSARDFVASLDEAQRDQATFPFDSADRKDWSNIPYTMHPRGGLSFGEMTEAQRLKAHALIRSGMSSQGYLKAVGIMHLDGYLAGHGNRRGGGEPPFGHRFYWIAIFGDPSGEKPWGWQLDGHHLALNFTVANGKAVMSPSFLGVDPAIAREDIEAGWGILEYESVKGLALVNSLNKEQRAKAILAERGPDDVFSGPRKADAVKNFEGIPAGELDPAQRGLLMQIIREFAGNLSHDLAREQLAKIKEAGLERVFFAWMGPTEGPFDSPYYYRVHGPTFLAEFDNAEPPGNRGSGDINHIHAVWRDRENDYGEDLLKKHYENHPHHAKKK